MRRKHPIIVLALVHELLLHDLLTELELVNAMDEVLLCHEVGRAGGAGTFNGACPTSPVFNNFIEAESLVFAKNHKSELILSLPHCLPHLLRLDTG